jgi:hypothetical protein
MGVEYYRIQRPSIYHPVTAGDIQFEVIQKSFLPLGREDLVSASLSCRAWRQAAIELIITQKRFDDQRAMASFACGMQLKSIIFGFEQYSIKTLDIVMRRVGKEYTGVIAQVVAPSLSSLRLDFYKDSECYEVLEIFFSSCLQIRHLRLVAFDFGDTPSSLSPMIKDGFSLLKSLGMENCCGDVIMFVEIAPIQTLSKIDFVSYGIGLASEIISAIAMKCRSLKSISLLASFYSWDFIHTIFGCCREIEHITICDSFQRFAFKNSEIVAIASLPRLNLLYLVSCIIEEGAASPLLRCKSLRNLHGVDIDQLWDVLPVIGGNLVDLRCVSGTEGLNWIIKYCPNLEALDIMIKNDDGNWLNDDEMILLSAEGVFKSRLKKLAKLVINRRTIRLGTDWEGEED